MKIRLLPFFLLCAFSLGVAVPKATAGETRQTVYVWDFAMRDRTHNVTTDNLTREFEVALVNAQKYSVLERRSMDNLVKQAGIESGIINSTEIPAKPKSTLQLQGADMVIFGEVFDDLSGSNVSVTVTFENWRGEKHLLREIGIPRDKIANKTDRDAAMDQLVRKIIGGTRSVMKAEAHGFLIEITKCHAQGESLTLDLEVVNNNDLDTAFAVNDINGLCYLIDDKNNQASASYARIANHEGRGIVSMDLISGQPVKCAVEFTGVRAQAAIIPRLYLNMAGGGQGFVVAFLNVPVER